MPDDLIVKTMNLVHRVILKLTGGRVGFTVAGMPVLELTTVGRKSGQRHSVMLTLPLGSDPPLVIVASKGGDDKPPAWLFNLQADPQVEVVLQGGPKTPMRARVATAEERAELWPQVASNQPRYAGYQRRTQREIALVLLES